MGPLDTILVGVLFLTIAESNQLFLSHHRLLERAMSMRLALRTTPGETLRAVCEQADARPCHWSIWVRAQEDENFNNESDHDPSGYRNGCSDQSDGSNSRRYYRLSIECPHPFTVTSLSFRSYLYEVKSP